MVEYYGDLKDWRNSCGTGAYEIKDYVTSSLIRFEKNENYCRTTRFMTTICYLIWILSECSLSVTLLHKWLPSEPARLMPLRN
jgi:ABC-type transport system substrate-binding protein